MGAEENFFKVGDVVRMIGAEIDMTVYWVSGDGTAIQAQWFSTTRLLQQGAFSHRILCKRRTS
jgi:uncharacterized protein YodC (DUF2158 family)